MPDCASWAGNWMRSPVSPFVSPFISPVGSSLGSSSLGWLDGLEDIRSILFITSNRGLSKRPKSFSVFSTTWVCSSALGWVTSMTWRRMSDSASSSKVARKAATTLGDNFWMKPTVSLNNSGAPEGNRTRLVTGSRVENSWSAAMTLPSLKALKRVLLPALV